MKSLQALSKDQLLKRCARRGIDKCKSKTKSQLIELIVDHKETAKKAKIADPVIIPSHKYIIYTLQLEHDKYYVGRTTNIKNRILQHMGRRGSEWTKIHKPICVLSEIPSDDTFDEEKHTLIAMNKYGITNVRGGPYCTIHLSPSDICRIETSILSATDKCYNCGESGHFVNKCTRPKKLKTDPSYTFSTNPTRSGVDIHIHINTPISGIIDISSLLGQTSSCKITTT